MNQRSGGGGGCAPLAPPVPAPMRLQSISSETIKDKWQALVTQRFAITSWQNSKNFLTANKAT